MRAGGGQSCNSVSEASAWEQGLPSFYHSLYDTENLYCLTVEEQTGTMGLGTKAIPGPRVSYLSHPGHSRQESPATVWLFLGADLVFSFLDFVPK